MIQHTYDWILSVHRWYTSPCFSLSSFSSSVAHLIEIGCFLWGVWCDYAIESLKDSAPGFAIIESDLFWSFGGSFLWDFREWWRLLLLWVCNRVLWFEGRKEGGGLVKSWGFHGLLIKRGGFKRLACGDRGWDVVQFKKGSPGWRFHAVIRNLAVKTVSFFEISSL